jgi:hypothetical protein
MHNPKQAAHSCSAYFFSLVGPVMGIDAFLLLYVTRSERPGAGGLECAHMEDYMGPICAKWKMVLATLLCLILVPETLPYGISWPAKAQSAPSSTAAYPGQGVPLSTEELDSMVSPIALYPDQLVAQILSAATFPDQVAVANNFLQINKSLTGTALAQAVNKESWDPSVKALTQFPTVLSKMAQSLVWTSQLGEAYHNQQPEVMAAIQELRKQAEAAGNLKTTSQQTVKTETQNGNQTIIIQPSSPQIVYVPTYNPTLIYGVPYSPPGYSTADLVATSMLSFGAGIAVGAMMSGGCCGWGWSSWNCNWYGGGVYYHGGAYYGNAAWHGGYYGHSGAAYGPYGSAHWGSGYNPSTGTFARGGTTSTAFGSRAAGQAYNPYTGAYGATRQASNAYGTAGASTYSRNGQTVDTQHISGANGNFGTAESSNGNRYATADGNAYRNTGSGWQKDTNGSWNNVQKPDISSDDARGWGSAMQSHAGGSSAFSGWGSRSGSSFGSGGWGSRFASSRGWASRGGGGGWGGGGFRGGGFRR